MIYGRLSCRVYSWIELFNKGIKLLNIFWRIEVLRISYNCPHSSSSTFKSVILSVVSFSFTFKSSISLVLIDILLSCSSNLVNKEDNLIRSLSIPSSFSSNSLLFIVDLSVISFILASISLYCAKKTSLSCFFTSS